MEDVPRHVMVARIGHGTTVDSLTATCSKHKISLKRSDYAERPVHLELSRSLMLKVKIVADKLNWTPERLITTLVETVAIDDLWLAVLDLDELKHEESGGGGESGGRVERVRIRTRPVHL